MQEATKHLDHPGFADRFHTDNGNDQSPFCKRELTTLCVRSLLRRRVRSRSPFFAAACAHLSNTASKRRGVALEFNMFLDENGADTRGQDFDLATCRSSDGRPGPTVGGLVGAAAPAVGSRAALGVRLLPLPTALGSSETFGQNGTGSRRLTGVVSLMAHCWALPWRMGPPIPHCTFISWDRVGRVHQHSLVASGGGRQKHTGGAQHIWCFQTEYRYSGKDHPGFADRFHTDNGNDQSPFCKRELTTLCVRSLLRRRARSRSPFFAAACAHLSNTASKRRGVALEFNMFLDENGADTRGQDFDLATCRSSDGRPGPTEGASWERLLLPLGPAPLWGSGCFPCRLLWVHPKHLGRMELGRAGSQVL